MPEKGGTDREAVRTDELNLQITGGRLFTEGEVAVISGDRFCDRSH